MKRVVVAVIAITLGACGGDDGAGDDDDAPSDDDALPMGGDIVITNGSGRIDLLALRDGDGAWTALTAGSDGTYHAHIESSTYEVMTLCSFSSGTHHRSHAFQGAAEAALTVYGCGSVADLGAKVTGHVINGGTDTFVYVDTGFDSNLPNGTDGGFSLFTAMGPGSVLVTEETRPPNGADSTYRFARKAIDATSGAATAEFDLATDAHASVATSIHLTNLDPTTPLTTDQYLIAPNEGYFIPDATAHTTGATPYFEALPAEVHLAGDEVTVYAYTYSTGAPITSLREVDFPETHVGDTFAMPAAVAFGAPTGTAGTVQWTLPAAARAGAAGSHVDTFISDSDLFVTGTASAAYLAAHPTLGFDSPTTLDGFTGADVIPNDYSWNINLVAPAGIATTYAGDNGSVGDNVARTKAGPDFHAARDRAVRRSLRTR